MLNTRRVSKRRHGHSSRVLVECLGMAKMLVKDTADRLRYLLRMWNRVHEDLGFLGRSDLEKCGPTEGSPRRHN